MGGVGWQSDRHEPWELLGRRRAGDALDAVGPYREFARFFRGHMPCVLLLTAEIATDPIGTLGAAGDDGAMFVEDLDDAARGQARRAERFMKALEHGADHEDGPHAAGVVRHRASKSDRPPAGATRADHLADGAPLSGQHLLEIGAVAHITASGAR